MIALSKLWNAMPRDVQRKISCHDLKRIVDNYNASPEEGDPMGTPDCWLTESLGRTTPQAAVPSLAQPDRDSLRMIDGVSLQEGDWAVECTNPGHFLKVHPDQFGKPATHPAYSFFRAKP